MTDASTRPYASPSLDSEPFGPLPPPPPAPPTTPSTNPSARWSTVALIVGGAFMANLALQGRVASVASLVAIGVSGLLILAAPGRRTPSAAGAVALAMLVGSNLVLRATEWVIGPTVIAALTLLVLAAFDQLTAARLSVVQDAGRVLLDGFLGSARHVASPLARWLGPASDQRAAVIRGSVIAGGVAVVLTMLLANADAVIGQAIEGGLQSSTWGHLALTAVLVVVFATASVVSHDSVIDSGESFAPAERPIEALMGLSAIVVVLGAWVTMQVAIAAGGADRLLATASVTRAEHAREGFFELVVVAAVVLALLTAFGQLLGDNKRALALALVAAVGVLSTALVAVTFSRLALYIDAFGLTMLRLSVAWFLGWLAFLIVAATAWSAGLRPQHAWLATLTVVSAALVVVAFGWSNPEATVAATNLSRDNAVVDLDVRYLEGLGPDATPTLIANGITPRFDCASEPQPFGPFGWNQSWDVAC